jgi:hypothetical protein
MSQTTHPSGPDHTRLQAAQAAQAASHADAPARKPPQPSYRDVALGFADGNPLDPATYDVADFAPPMVQVMDCYGGFACAVITANGNPNGPNIAEIMLSQLITAFDQTVLAPRIISALIANFGMAQADAEALPQVIMTPEGPPLFRETARAAVHERTAPTPTQRPVPPRREA